MQENKKEIYAKFKFEGKFEAEETIAAGHINHTYMLRFRKEDGTVKKYLLQKINTNVFRDPYALMENVRGVTSHIRKKIKAQGGDPSRSTLHVVETIGHTHLYCDANREYWRAYDFIDDAIAYHRVERPILFYNAGMALGKFQNLLSDYPADMLSETIPDFHNTPWRFQAFLQAVQEDRAGRASAVRQEIGFVCAREALCHVVTDQIAAGRIPVRVTHNDTKLNNVLMDSRTDEALCLIDLDTVMPGSALYDFGDSIRFGASSAEEDEQDLAKVYLDRELFEQYTRGYLSQVAPVLTPTEKDLLATSAILLTLECGSRFLADYLNGDTYFQIHRENHNLDRARTQFKLVADMERRLDQMNDIVDKAYRDCLA